MYKPMFLISCLLAGYPCFTTENHKKPFNLKTINLSQFKKKFLFGASLPSSTRVLLILEHTDSSSCTGFAHVEIYFLTIIIYYTVEKCLLIQGGAERMHVFRTARIQVSLVGGRGIECYCVH